VARVIRIADCPPVPWKNGAGTTRELWALRDDAGETVVRISIAEIRGAQTFSAFPGTDRVILQLDGPAMVLTVNGIPHPLAARARLAFPGEAQVTCSVSGPQPAHDLNLMCRRGAFQPAMARIETGSGIPMAAGAPDAITALLPLGPVTLTLPLAVSLQAHDLLVAEGAFRVQTVAPAVFVRLTARILAGNT
jgi:environmental stress-induced protein Ves